MATIKQKLAFKKVVKGSTITQAMKEVNYAPSTASRTNKLTRTKGWQELIEKHISEAALTKVHAEGLKATKRQGVGGMVLNTEKGEFGHSEIEVPDYAVRHKYLETGYKIRGRLKEAEGDTNKILIINVTQSASSRYGTDSSTSQDSGGQTQIQST